MYNKVGFVMHKNIKLVISCPICKKWHANPYYITQQMLIHDPKWIIKEIFTLLWVRVKYGKFPD